VKGQVRSYFFAFETVKGLVLTLSLVLPISLGIHYDAFGQGFCFALGTFFTYLPNTEGSNRHRFWGILFALVLGLTLLSLAYLTRSIHLWLFYVYFIVAIFCVAMLAVYGFRGAMLSFSGQAALVMSFALQKVDLPVAEQLLLVFAGGIWYLFLAWLSHWIIQNRAAAFTLADCVDLTAEFLKLRYELLWNDPKEPVKLEQRLNKLQIDLNARHEVLRELLFNKRRTEGQSNRTNRLLLIFLEMLDMYELALATGNDAESIKDTFSQHPQYTEPFRELSAKTIVHLYGLAEAIRTSTELPLEEETNPFYDLCERQIKDYVRDISLPLAREGSLVLRNLLDYESKQWEKVQSAKRVFVNLLEGKELTLKRTDRKAFITSQDYSWKVLRENLSLQSTSFRHASRMAVTMLIGLLVSLKLDHQNAYWILITISVILRPNYGLTKQRGFHRILGTLAGAAFSLTIVYFTNDNVIFACIAIPATFIGFSFLQKNYRIAATFITVAILMMYAIMVDNTFEIVSLRVIDTFIGAFISLLAVYFFWPSWEGKNIRKFISKAILANGSYLKEIDRIYHSKETPDSVYRLARKKAFLETGNLMAAFQRLTEEPKSQRNHQAQVQAMVVLIQTFLNSTAALGTFIQNHTTTPASKSFEIIIEKTLKNLHDLLKAGSDDQDADSDETEEAISDLEQKYSILKDNRAKELEDGQIQISAEMRTQLQEAKLITEQLKYLLNLSENMIQVNRYID
jgi:uncharacterized membrane protein YccC